MIADSTNQGARAIAENFETIRTANEDEYKRTAEAMRNIYDQTTQDAEGMLSQAAGRFAEVVDGLKRMAAEMQRELDATRNELRKGILELPQETADSAAQMRRVIVDQIEALAELNRIVARHGRGLDTVEPAARAASSRPRRWARVASPARNRSTPTATAPRVRRRPCAGAPTSPAWARRRSRRPAAPNRRR